MGDNIIPFSKYLDKKMKERYLSVSDLSQSMQVDKSLIYKWIKSERYPSVKKEQLKKLIEVLHLSLRESKEMLFSYYLSARQDGIEKNRLLRSLLSGLNKSISNAPPNIELTALHTDFSHFHQLIMTRENPSVLFECFTYAQNNLKEGDYFHISSNWDVIKNDAVTDYTFDTIEVLLDNGVTVHHIINTNQDAIETMQLLQRIWGILLEYTNYTITLFNQYGALYFPELIVCRHFALNVCKTSYIADTALAYIDMVNNEFAVLCNHTRPFVERISEQDFCNEIRDISPQGETYNLLELLVSDLSLDIPLEKLENIITDKALQVYTKHCTEMSAEAVEYSLVRELIEMDKFTVIDDDLFPTSAAARFIVKKGVELLFAVQHCGRYLYLKVTEKTMTDEFAIFADELIRIYKNQEATR